MGGGVIIVVFGRRGYRGGGGRGKNNEYENDEDNTKDGIHVRRKVVDVGGFCKGLGTTG